MRDGHLSYYCSLKVDDPRRVMSRPTRVENAVQVKKASPPIGYLYRLQRIPVRLADNHLPIVVEFLFQFFLQNCAQKRSLCV